ncbi:MAG: hypothetical protein AAGC97_02255 [Planctomycetota bacterium]
MTTMQWLWALAGMAAFVLICRSMAWRQSRLTTLLKEHVERTQAEHEAAVEAAKARKANQSN